MMHSSSTGDLRRYGSPADDPGFADHRSLFLSAAPGFSTKYIYIYTCTHKILFRE